MIYSFLKKLYRRLSAKIVFGEKDSMSLEEQKAYLAAFPDPKDDYERSFFKYKCFFEYCYHDRAWVKLLYNVGACLILPFVRLKLTHISPKASERTVDALYENVPRLPNDDILPDIVKEQHKITADIIEINYEGIFLDPCAKDICLELKKRYFFSFYFRLIVMIKLAQFSQYLQTYHPKAILFYSCERDFSGPLLTLLCERKGSRYEAYMHGDYIFTLCFAFQRYSTYYTWDELYNEMFQQLRCDFPMVVYVPGKLKGIAKKKDDRTCRYFATYYFSDESKQSASIIHEAFKTMHRHGLRCKIRPHPRFSDIDMLRRLFSDFEIEDTRAYPLADSIQDSFFVIGLNTTVLSQAFFSNKTVVIDDISDPRRYQQLESRGFIMLRRPHRTLSEVMQSLEKDFPYDDSWAFMIRKMEGDI